MRITFLAAPVAVVSAAAGDVGLGETDVEADGSETLPVPAGTPDEEPSEHPAGNRRAPVMMTAPRRRAGMPGTIGPPG